MRPVVVGIGEILWDLLPSGKQLGGAPANFAYHAGALGARARVVSAVGKDVLGREILARLDAVPLDRVQVAIDPAHPTGTVDVHLDARGVPDYVIRQPVAWDYVPSSAALLALAAIADAVCFGSLAQRGNVSRATLRDFLRSTPAKCLHVFDINLRQHFYDRKTIESSLALSSVLKLNDDELAKIATLLALPAADPIAALLARYPLKLIALTRGRAGSVLATRTERHEHPGYPTTIADTIGAGDAFTASLVMGLLAGHDLPTINIAANRLAAFVCSKRGAMPAHSA